MTVREIFTVSQHWYQTQTRHGRIGKYDQGKSSFILCDLNQEWMSQDISVNSIKKILKCSILKGNCGRGGKFTRMVVY